MQRRGHRFLIHSFRVGVHELDVGQKTKTHMNRKWGEFQYSSVYVRACPKTGYFRKMAESGIFGAWAVADFVGKTLPEGLITVVRDGNDLF